MAGALATVDRLHRALARLDAADDADVTWLAGSLRLWLAGAPWHAALDLGNDWRDVLAQRQQQAALAALVATLPPMSCRAAADDLAARLRAYETTSWRTDHPAGRRPAGERGVLFDYLAAGGPTSRERLRKLLPACGSPSRVP